MLLALILSLSTHGTRDLRPVQLRFMAAAGWVNEATGRSSLQNSYYPKLRRVLKFINYLQFNTASLRTAAVMGRDMFIVSLEMIKPKPVAYVKFEQLRYHTRRLDRL